MSSHHQQHQPQRKRQAQHHQVNSTTSHTVYNSSDAFHEVRSATSWDELYQRKGRPLRRKVKRAGTTSTTSSASSQQSPSRRKGSDGGTQQRQENRSKSCLNIRYSSSDDDSKGSRAPPPSEVGSAYFPSQLPRINGIYQADQHAGSRSPPRPVSDTSSPSRNSSRGSQPQPVFLPGDPYETTIRVPNHMQMTNIPSPTVKPMPSRDAYEQQYLRESLMMYGDPAQPGDVSGLSQEGLLDNHARDRTPMHPKDKENTKSKSAETHKSTLTSILYPPHSSLQQQQIEQIRLQQVQVKQQMARQNEQQTQQRDQKPSMNRPRQKDDDEVRNEFEENPFPNEPFAELETGSRKRDIELTVDTSFGHPPGVAGFTNPKEESKQHEQTSRGGWRSAMVRTSQPAKHPNESLRHPNLYTDYL